MGKTNGQIEIFERPLLSMIIHSHIINNIKIAEVLAPEIIIKDAEDGLSILGDLYYQDFDRILLHEQNITAQFFDLKTGIAGEILQKFSNYRVKLAIVGDFTKYPGKSLADFIYESNKGGQVSFVNSTVEALANLSKQ